MKKTKHIIVRITEAQFKQLADTLIIEQKSKSEIARNALELYLNPATGQSEIKNLKKDKNQKSSRLAPEILPMEEKYISLDVEDIFPASDFTTDEVAFGEYFLDKLRVDLESPVKVKYFLSPSQLIYLIVGIKREYEGYLGLEGKIDGKGVAQVPGETGYIIQSKPQKAPFD